MHSASGRISPWVDWAVASDPLPGEPESADRHAIVARPDGVLAVVIDGLGHGPPAVASAKRAIEVVETHANDPVDKLLDEIHRALVGTRGAVGTVAVLDVVRSVVTWGGVGDVEAVRLSASGQRREAPLLLAGVLGDRVPRVRVNEVPVAVGDVLVLATDGIRRAFLDEPILNQPAHEAALRIIERHRRVNDDALVLVVKYTGP